MTTLQAAAAAIPATRERDPLRRRIGAGQAWPTR